MIKLLAFCDDPAVPTGFGKVAQHVLKPLVDRGEYEVHICAINYKGDMRDPADHPYHYWAPYLSRQADLYGIGRARALIRQVKPDVVWILNDLPIVAEYFKLAQAELAGVPVVTYSPVDGDPFPRSYLDGIRHADVPVVYCDYAKRVIGEMDQELGERLRIIGHGHDPQEFYPLCENKAIAKQMANKMLGNQLDPDWFIVLRVDKNQERKNWPATLGAFAQFAQDKPNARLWAHTPFVIDGGYDIPALCERYGIADKVINPGLTPRKLGVPVAILNAIYNVADVHLSTTAGGGWELSTHEAMAAGTPAIVTDYAAMGDVFEDAAVMLDWYHDYVSVRNTTRYVYADKAFASGALGLFYADQDVPIGLGPKKRADALVWAKNHTWAAQCVTERFDAAFKEAICAHA